MRFDRARMLRFVGIIVDYNVRHRTSRGQRQGVDSNLVGEYERVGFNIKRIRAILELLEGGSDILRAPNFQRVDLKAERAGRCLNLAHLQHGVGVEPSSNVSVPTVKGNHSWAGMIW